MTQPDVPDIAFVPAPPTDPELDERHDEAQRWELGPDPVQFCGTLGGPRRSTPARPC